MATRADQRKYHYIYKITRSDGSGKYYVGMHSTDDIDDGYFGSGSLLSRSIKKHGKDKHVKEILEYLPTREALKLREKEIVNEECVADKLCMNLRLGGEGGWEHVNSILTADQRSAGGTASMKVLWAREDFAIKQSAFAKSKMIKIHQDGKVKTNQFAGKAHTLETKLKMSLVASQRTGEKNSQYGSCWVTNGVKPIKIRKEQLEEYLLNGYSKGRKNMER